MKHPKQHGFTLLEIIIVVLIVGIVVTMASLSFNAIHGPREVRQFADQLTQKLKFTSQIAELLPGEFGFSINGNTLSFYQLMTDDGPPYWDPILDMSILREQHLPSTIELIIESENANQFATANSSLFSPAIQFFSNGNITPFEMTIYDNKQPEIAYTIVGNLAGEITRL